MQIFVNQNYKSFFLYGDIKYSCLLTSNLYSISYYLHLKMELLLNVIKMESILFSRIILPLFRIICCIFATIDHFNCLILYSTIQTLMILLMFSLIIYQNLSFFLLYSIVKVYSFYSVLFFIKLIL